MLGDAARAELERLCAEGFVEAWKSFEERVTAHRARITRIAHELGARVARHEVAINGATAQLRRLALETDPEAPIPILLLPYSQAVELLSESFRSGFDTEVAA